MKRSLGTLLLLLISATAGAHPLAPALLELEQTGVNQYTVLWRTSATRAAGTDVAPRFPPVCSYQQTGAATLDANEAVAVRGLLRCAQPLAGNELAVDGLEASRINVILRLRPSGAAEAGALLDARAPSWTVPQPGPARPLWLDYLALGIEHLLTGLDHVLFVTGLFLLVRGMRPLVLTVTAFTFGHSITLSLAALGLVRVSQPLAELGIALTILVLAVELARPAGQPAGWIARKPWAMAAAFGLLHGLGFAGALADIGLPQQSIPLALLSFNLGIECGQLLLLAVLLALAAGWKKVAAPTAWLPLGRTLPVYAIGSCAALWCYARGILLLS